MEFLLTKIRMIYEFLLFNPKSSTTSTVLLFIVILIAYFVNRKRDATGQVSFVDRTKSGVIGVRVYEINEGQRKRSWLFPLWIPEKELLLNVKILLPKGEYDINAYWRAEVSRYMKEGLFTARPIEREKEYSLSGFGRFKIAKDTPVEFKLTASDKKMQIDSPDKSALEADPAKKPFPLAISDPSFKKLAAKFEKLNQSGNWVLSIIDDRIVTNLENEIRVIHQKLDGGIIKNQELKSDLDQVVRKLKTLQKDSGSKKDAKKRKPKAKVKSEKP